MKNTELLAGNGMKLELKSITKKDISKYFFYAGIIAELIVSFTGYLLGGYHENLIILAGMGLFCISILLDFDIKRDILICAVCALYGCACYYFQHSAFVLRIALAILAGRRQDVKKVFTVFFWGTLVTMLFFGILSVLGLHNQLFVTDFFRSDEESRLSFGFYHPNGFALFLFRTAIMGMFVYIDRMKLLTYALYSLPFVVLMVMVRSKIGLGVLVFGIVLFGIYRFGSKKLVKIISLMSSIGVVLLWLYIRLQDLFYYGDVKWNKTMHRIWMFVDKVTTGRSGDSYYAMVRNKATWFGVGFGPETSEMGIVDSIYCQGIIFMIILLAVTVWLYRKMIKDGNIAAVIVIAVTVLYSIAESFLEYFNKNMIWLLCIGVLFAIREKGGEDNSVKKEDKD